MATISLCLPTEAQAIALTSEDVKQWVMPALKKGFLELSIVGDLNVEKVIPILARTIGALPQRSAIKPAYETERILTNLPAPPMEKRYTFESRVAPGTAMVLESPQFRKGFYQDYTPAQHSEFYLIE